MALLTKAQIVQVVDLKTETVSVPEWGGEVLVREFTGADRDAFENSMVTVGADGKRQADLQNLRAKLVAATVVDSETGQLMFDAQEVHLLGAKSAVALERVFQVAQRINGMTADAVDAAAKNSDGAPSAASTSD